MKRVEDGVGCCILRIQIFIIVVKKTTAVLCCENFFFLNRSVRARPHSGHLQNESFTDAALNNSAVTWHYMVNGKDPSHLP